MGLKYGSPQHPDSAPARAGSCHLSGSGCTFLADYLIALSPGIPRATPVFLSQSYARAGQCPAVPAWAAFCDLCVFTQHFGEAFASSGPPTC